MNLWICSPKRAFSPSASIHSASSCGSTRQCEASRVPAASLRNAGERITELTRELSSCSPDEVAREFVITPAGNHELHLIAGQSAHFRFSMRKVSPSPESGHFTSTIFTTPAGTALQRPLAAGLQQDGIACDEEALHQRDHFALLQKRFATGDLDQSAVGRKPMHFVLDFLEQSCRCPPLKVYSLSHQVQRRLHPASRTKTQGSPV